MSFHVNSTNFKKDIRPYCTYHQRYGHPTSHCKERQSRHSFNPRDGDHPTDQEIRQGKSTALISSNTQFYKKRDL